MNNAEQNLNDSFEEVSYLSTGLYNMKGTPITSEMMKNARRKYAALLGDALRIKENNSNSQSVLENTEKNDEKNNVVEFEKQKSNALTLKPEVRPPMKKAGFADALILTVIVLVYAVIIINLILKIK